MNNFYNLITGYGSNGAGNCSMELYRVMDRYTTTSIKERFTHNGEIDFDALRSLPCLFIPEKHRCDEQLTRVGSVSDISLFGREIRFQVTYDETIPPLDCNWIWNNDRVLGFEGSDWQKSRSEWAVNPGNLHQLLLQNLPFRRFGGETLNGVSSRKM